METNFFCVWKTFCNVCILAEFFFNKRKDQQSQNQPLKIILRRQPFTESPRSEWNKGLDSPAKNSKPASRNGSLVKGDF